MASRLGIPPTRVKETVEKWMHRKPLSFIRRFAFKDVERLFADLRRARVRIAVFSDYPAHQKLEMLGLEADFVLCSTESAIDALKPKPASLLAI